MALFTKKTKASVASKSEEVKTTTKAVATVTATKQDAPAQKVGGIDAHIVLRRPHITEKATDLSERNVYAFEIDKHANKTQVKQAVEKFYKVRPVKIAIISGREKTMRHPRTNRVQMKRQAIKKALVYLKKGDKLDFV